MTQMVRHGHHAMGRVSIWKQWLIVAAGVSLSPAFVLFLAWFIGWSLLRRLWPRPEVKPATALAPVLRAVAAPPPEPERPFLLAPTVGKVAMVVPAARPRRRSGTAGALPSRGVPT